MEDKHKRYLKNARTLRTNMTLAEQTLWNKVRRKQLGYKFLRQYIIDNLLLSILFALRKK